jgi:hypothetical protein
VSTPRKPAPSLTREARREVNRNGTIANSVSYLIENLQRRHEWYRALEAQNQALHGARPRKSDPLGFEFEEIQFLRRHAIQEFLHDAELGRQEMVLLEEHLRRPLSVFPRDEFAVKLAESYARAIKRATGEYADLLTQVLLSRTRVRSLREKTRMSICSQAIQFAEELSTPALHDSWADNTQAPTFPLGSAPFQERDQTFFWERMKMYRSDWSLEAYRRITLRFLLAGGKEVAVRTDPFRRRVARLVIPMLNAADRDICREMDSQNERALSENRKIPFPVPKPLERSSFRRWADPFDEKKSELIQVIHELLSKIRKEFGLRTTDPRPNRAPFPPKPRLDSRNLRFRASDNK